LASQSLTNAKQNITSLHICECYGDIMDVDSELNLTYN